MLSHSLPRASWSRFPQIGHRSRWRWLFPLLIVLVQPPSHKQAWFGDGHIQSTGCKCIPLLPDLPSSTLRKDRDSNPRNGHPFTAFRVRRHRPLGHLSNRNQNVLSSAIDKQMPQLIIKCCKPHTNAANVPTKKLRFSFRTAKVLLFSELCKFFSCFLHFSSQFHLSRPSIMAGVLKNEAFCI